MNLDNTIITDSNKKNNVIDTSSYTESIAYDKSRMKSRTTIKYCLLNMAPSSMMLDRILGFVSFFTGIFITFTLIGGSIALIPSILMSKYYLGHTSWFNPHGSQKGGGDNNQNIIDTNNEKKKHNNNVSTTSSGSVTALKTLNARSQMYLQGSGGPDYLAPLLLNQLSLFGRNIPGSKLVSDMYRILVRWNFYLTGRIWVDQLAQLMPINFPIGEQTYLHVRTCWLDDCIETFIRNNNNNKLSGGASRKINANVVILGAGYDTRCYRLHLQERGVSTYEVDTPGTQSMKLEALKAANINTGTTKFVACDFEKEDWLENLKNHGFDSNKPTFFVWEGVTMYIDRKVVIHTLQNVASYCAKGSCIGLDYVDSTWALTPQMRKKTERGGEPWKFGLHDTEVEELILECNHDLSSSKKKKQQYINQLRIWDHLKYEELLKRYVGTHSDGRHMGYLGDFGGLLLVGNQNQRK